MSKIKVLQVIRQGKIGGGESHVIDVVKNLDKDNFVTEVLSFTPGPMVETLQKLGIKCNVIYSENAFDIKVWGKVKELVLQGDFNLVHAHGTRAMSNVFGVAKANGLPLVYTVHGWSFHDDQRPLVRYLRTRSEKFLIHFANQVINVSESNRASGIEKLGKFSSQVINNGIDLNRFDASKERSHDLLDSLKIAHDNIVVGAINRVTHQKNPLGLLRGFEIAARSNEKLHLLVVGEGDLYLESQNYAVELGLEGRVTFAGNRQDVPEILSVIDIFCLPSFWEGLSLGLLEAMAMKKCIIASKVDGTREVIEDRVNGLLFEAGNDEEMSSLMLQVAADPTLRIELGESALASVKANHSAQAMVNAIECEYVNICK